MIDDKSLLHAYMSDSFLPNGNEKPIDALNRHLPGVSRELLEILCSSGQEASKAQGLDLATACEYEFVAGMILGLLAGRAENG